jgi:hypothetical protein
MFHTMSVIQACKLQHQQAPKVTKSSTHYLGQKNVMSLPKKSSSLNFISRFHRKQTGKRVSPPFSADLETSRFVGFDRILVSRV